MLFMVGSVSHICTFNGMEADSAVFGQAAIRQGRWKAVWLPPPTGNDKWLLYDISTGECLLPSSAHCLTQTDPGETKDLADVEVEKLRELIEYWHQYEAETGTVLKGANDAPGGGRFFGVKWDDWDAQPDAVNIGYGPR